VEIVERALGLSLLEPQRALFEKRVVVWSPPAVVPQLWGKAVLYARDDLRFPADGPWMDALQEPVNETAFADIPTAGDWIPRGRPVITVFASAPTAEECEQRLQQQAQALDRYIWGS